MTPKGNPVPLLVIYHNSMSCATYVENEVRVVQCEVVRVYPMGSIDVVVRNGVGGSVFPVVCGCGGCAPCYVSVAVMVML